MFRHEKDADTMWFYPEAKQRPQINLKLEHLSFKSEALGDVIMCGHRPKAPFRISFLIYLVSVSFSTYLSVSAMDFIEKENRARKMSVCPRGEQGEQPDITGTTANMND